MTRRLLTTLAAGLMLVATDAKAQASQYPEFFARHNSYDATNDTEGPSVDNDIVVTPIQGSNFSVVPRESCGLQGGSAVTDEDGNAHLTLTPLPVGNESDPQNLENRVFAFPNPSDAYQATKVPEGSRIFDVTGRDVTEASSLAAGSYFVLGPNNDRVKFTKVETGAVEFLPQTTQSAYSDLGASARTSPDCIADVFVTSSEYGYDEQPVGTVRFESDGAGRFLDGVYGRLGEADDESSIVRTNVLRSNPGTISVGDLTACYGEQEVPIISQGRDETGALNFEIQGGPAFQIYEKTAVDGADPFDESTERFGEASPVGQFVGYRVKLGDISLMTEENPVGEFPLSLYQNATQQGANCTLNLK